AEIFRDIGQADERFNLSGGGALNLYIYRLVALHPRTEAYVLAGEGSFHQLHGGVTTSESIDRERILERQSSQLSELLGYTYTSPTVEPILLGKIRQPAMRYLKQSVERGSDRLA